jgi:hypothetical protein
MIKINTTIHLIAILECSAKYSERKKRKKIVSRIIFVKK